MSGRRTGPASQTIENATIAGALAHAEARIGRTVAGRWTLEKVLGVGGMASVYVARHRNGRRAALKVLHPTVAIHEAARRRFLSEGYAANKIDHPGAVLILDDGEDAELVFLVMELLEGQTLAERLAEEGPLSVREVVRIATALLEVLAAAHDRGVIHRDVKPSNVFELDGGRVKLLDFGVARVRDAESGTVTDSGVTLGTPAFMAPEQAAGRHDEVDALTDIWAVGATMFQLLTGRLVHDERTTNAAIVAAATRRAVSVSELRPDVSPAVSQVVDRALAFNKEDRYPNARAMHQALLAEPAERRPLSPETGIVTLPEAPAARATRRKSMARDVARLGFVFTLLAALAALASVVRSCAGAHARSERGTEPKPAVSKTQALQEPQTALTANPMPAVPTAPMAVVPARSPSSAPSDRPSSAEPHPAPAQTRRKLLRPTSSSEASSSAAPTLDDRLPDTRQ